LTGPAPSSRTTHESSAVVVITGLMIIAARIVRRRMRIKHILRRNRELHLGSRSAGDLRGTTPVFFEAGEGFGGGVELGGEGGSFGAGLFFEFESQRKIGGCG